MGRQEGILHKPLEVRNYRQRESNPHEQSSTDFKSVASTNSAISAPSQEGLLCRLESKKSTDSHPVKLVFSFLSPEA